MAQLDVSVCDDANCPFVHITVGDLGTINLTVDQAQNLGLASLEAQIVARMKNNYGQAFPPAEAS